MGDKLFILAGSSKRPGMLLQQFKTFIKEHHLFSPNDRLIVAVSGGVDSVVLCELCHRAGVDFVMAHCNFQLRGAESERDEAFVQELAAKYEVPFFVKRFDTALYAELNGLSIQVAARNLRYDWFHELALGPEMMNRSVSTAKPKSRLFIATAHHANDSMETLLMNFFKGTGIKGLQGIKPKHELMGNTIRPLLFAKKEQLLSFAGEQGLSYVEDSSNETDKYTRNYFRNQLIPGLQSVFPQVEENLLNNLNRFSEIEVLYEEAMQFHRRQLLEVKGNELHIPVLKLLKVKALQTVLYEIIRPFHFTAHQVEEAMGLLHSESGKYIQSATHRVIRNRNWLIITPLLDTTARYYLIESTDRAIQFSAGLLTITQQETAGQIVKDNHIAQLDAAEIKFPLLLRRWKTGDYFYPLGMQKKKKLSRFFIDQKLAISQKENAWVVEMNKKIIWVVGMRIDDRFKVTSATKAVLLLRIKPGVQ